MPTVKPDQEGGTSRDEGVVVDDQEADQAKKTSNYMPPWATLHALESRFKKSTGVQSTSADNPESQPDQEGDTSRVEEAVVDDQEVDEAKKSSNYMPPWATLHDLESRFKKSTEGKSTSADNPESQPDQEGVTSRVEEAVVDDQEIDEAQKSSNYMPPWATLHDLESRFKKSTGGKSTSADNTDGQSDHAADTKAEEVVADDRNVEDSNQSGQYVPPWATLHDLESRFKKSNRGNSMSVSDTGDDKPDQEVGTETEQESADNQEVELAKQEGRSAVSEARRKHLEKVLRKVERKMRRGLEQILEENTNQEDRGKASKAYVKEMKGTWKEKLVGDSDDDLTRDEFKHEIWKPVMKILEELFENMEERLEPEAPAHPVQPLEKKHESNSNSLLRDSDHESGNAGVDTEKSGQAKSEAKQSNGMNKQKKVQTHTGEEDSESDDVKAKLEKLAPEVPDRLKSMLSNVRMKMAKADGKAPKTKEKLDRDNSLPPRSPVGKARSFSGPRKSRKSMESSDDDDDDDAKFDALAPEVPKAMASMLANVRAKMALQKSKEKSTNVDKAASPPPRSKSSGLVDLRVKLENEGERRRRRSERIRGTSPAENKKADKLPKSPRRKSEQSCRSSDGDSEEFTGKNLDIAEEFADKLKKKTKKKKKSSFHDSDQSLEISEEFADKLKKKAKKKKKGGDAGSEEFEYDSKSRDIAEKFTDKLKKKAKKKKNGGHDSDEALEIAEKFADKLKKKAKKKKDRP